MPDHNPPESSQHHSSKLATTKPATTKSATTKPVTTRSSSLNSTAVATPWYYQLAITLAKPLYRMTLWRRHQKAKKQGSQKEHQIANYQEEINARFGKSYPPAPVLSQAQTNPKAKVINSESGETGDNLAYLSEFGMSPMIWCHAVSLGETNTIAPMLNIMLKKGAKIWLTNTTQTGFARGEKLFAEAILSKQLVHTFVPTDDKKVIHTFLDHVQPNLAMFVETELWANILSELTKSNIPSVLVNGRLSQKSFESYQKFRAVSQSMMQNISMIIAQDNDSAKRFRKLGAPAAKIRRAASLKWSSGQHIDEKTTTSFQNMATSVKNTTTSESVETASVSDSYKSLPDDFISDAFIKSVVTDAGILERPIWVAGSTHEGEEQLILQAHKKLVERLVDSNLDIKSNGLQNTLLIMVPRHPERFDSVADVIDKSGLSMVRRSDKALIDRTTQVYLADTMGELEHFYQLADVCFVGGSLVDIGGHNPIEASAFAKPVIMGDYTQSCYQLVNDLQEVSALSVVDTAKGTEQTIDDLYNILSHWLKHPDVAMQAGRSGQALVKQKSDALQNQLTMIEQLLATTLKADWTQYDLSETVLSEQMTSDKETPDKETLDKETLDKETLDKEILESKDINSKPSNSKQADV